MRSRDLPKIQGVKDKKFSRKRSIKYSILGRRSWQFSKRYTGYNWLTQKDKLLLVTAYIKFLHQKLLDGYKIELPCFLGYMQIIGRKQDYSDNNKNSRNRYRALNIDWHKTFDLWGINEEARRNRQFVYHLNEHSNGLKFKFRYTKQYCNFPNKSYYYMKIVRQLKLKLADIIFNQDYSRYEVLMDNIDEYTDKKVKKRKEQQENNQK